MKDSISAFSVLGGLSVVEAVELENFSDDGLCNGNAGLGAKVICGSFAQVFE
jgi:hypothetical protein